MYNVTDAEFETLTLTVKGILSAAKTNKVLIRKRDMLAFFNVDRGLAEELLSEQINDLLSVHFMCAEFGEWIFVNYEDNGIFIQLNKPNQKHYGWEGMVLSGEAEVFDFKHLMLQAEAASSN